VSGEFGAVVASDELGVHASGGGDFVERGDGGVGVDRVGDQIGQVADCCWLLLGR
jgi:hypothetical protein